MRVNRSFVVQSLIALVTFLLCLTVFLSKAKPANLDQEVIFFLVSILILSFFGWHLKRKTFAISLLSFLLGAALLLVIEVYFHLF